jgi:hypothetical protein
MSAIMNNQNVSNIQPVQRGRDNADMHYRCSHPNCTFNTINVNTPSNRKQTIETHMARHILNTRGTRVSSCFTRTGDNVICNRCNKQFTKGSRSHLAVHMREDRLLPEPVRWSINQDQEAHVEQEPVQEPVQEQEAPVEQEPVQGQEVVQDVQQEQVAVAQEEEQLSNRDLLMVIRDQNKTVLEQNKTIQMLLVNLFRREPQTNPFDNLL